MWNTCYTILVNVRNSKMCKTAIFNNVPAATLAKVAENYYN